MSHQQIKIMEGVYMTDFRKGAGIKGLEVTKNLPKDVNLMMDDLHQLQSKIVKLLESIDLIKQEEDWHNEQVYIQSIHQNYGLILKYSDEQLETGKQVKQLNYNPQKKQDHEVLDEKRISERKTKAQGQFADFLKKYFKAPPAQQQDEGVFV